MYLRVQGELRRSGVEQYLCTLDRNGEQANDGAVGEQSAVPARQGVGGDVMRSLRRVATCANGVAARHEVAGGAYRGVTAGGAGLWRLFREGSGHSSGPAAGRLGNWRRNAA